MRARNRTLGQPSPGTIGAALALALLFCSAAAGAQSTVQGTVVEEGTDRPIGTVDIRLVDASGSVGGRTITDVDGRFRLEVPAGSYRVAVQRLGYRAIESELIEFEDGGEFAVDVRMSASAVPLAAVTVTARRRAEPNRIVEFRERAEESQRLGRGRVYMRDDIDRIRPPSAGAVLAAFPWGNRCQPEILIDGMPPVESLSGIGPDDIEGIEMYRGVTQIPPEYYRYGMCGLALIWRRTDPPGMRRLTWSRAIVAGVIVGLLAFLGS